MLMNNRNQIVTSKKERLHWLDYSKTIGMYLVVLGHVLKDNAQLFKVVIYSFHMPLFFFLSGFLYKLKIGGGKYFFIHSEAIGNSIPDFQWFDIHYKNKRYTD